MSADEFAKNMFEPLNNIEDLSYNLKCGIKALVLLHAAMEHECSAEDGVEPLYYLSSHLFDEVHGMKQLVDQAFKAAGYQV